MGISFSRTERAQPMTAMTEGDADAVALDVLGRNGEPTWAPDRCPDQHDDRGHQLDAPLVGEGGRTIETGDGMTSKRSVPTAT